MAVTKATLINSAGNKVVVDSGSAQANTYFSQGYKLMGASSPAAPVNPAPVDNSKLAPATNVPSPTVTKTNTLAAYDQKGNQVYVQPGTYNPGISATKPDLNAEINAGQDQNITDATNKTDGTPGVSKSSAAMDAIKSVVTPDVAKPAEVPKLLDTYNGLKTSYGVTDLETQLNDLKNSEELLRTTATNRKDYVEGKPVALGVISGKQSEVDRQTDKQLTENLRQQNYLSNQLKTKYDIISNVMNFTQKDYENASAAYDKEFSQNIQLLQQVRADETASTNEENIKLDNARADYTIFINAIKDGSIDMNTMSASQKSILNKLEVQQGLPVGTYEMLVPKTANKALTSLGTDNNSSGGRSAYFMSVDKTTGKPSIISIPLPGAVTTKAAGSGTVKETPEDKQITAFRNDASTMIEKLDSNSLTWATAWAQLRAKYPDASSELIDTTLGGGYDASKGGWYGRAKTATSIRKL